ncbi:MAG: hypothetical protein V3V97_00285 [Hyphomicrobiaceae bacterium]
MLPRPAFSLFLELFYLQGHEEIEQLRGWGENFTGRMPTAVMKVPMRCYLCRSLAKSLFDLAYV